MLLIAGTFRLPPGQIAAARIPMQAMVAASRAEDGCLDYSYAEDVIDPGLIHVFERWRDGAALEAHFATPHLVAWRASWAALGIGDRDLTRYEAGEAQPV